MMNQGAKKIVWVHYSKKLSNKGHIPSLFCAVQWGYLSSSSKLLPQTQNMPQDLMQCCPSSSKKCYSKILYKYESKKMDSIWINT